MHLRALRLRGFKSFAEPVELRFEPGVAVVVGPNGSGKSNIAEAAAWAMASQPPSEMRAQTTADVVFAGSAQRPPSAVCEVELILDNADGGFGSGRPEVSVMRRVIRDGDASYLLNRVAVRRLDVQEALADAGLGRELHAIVSQGKVEEILLSSAAQRRGYIEEAAGLGKYKRRRSRALIKLGHVERNLERVRDQERELRARLRPLAVQASSAERSAALAAEANQARVEVAGSRIAALRRQRAACGERLTAARAASETVEAALIEAQSARSAVEAELTGMVAAQERASARYVSLARACDRLEARRQGLADRRGALADDQARARSRLQRLGADAAAHADGAAKLAREADALLRADPEPDVDDAKLAALSAETQEALRDLLAARGELADIDARLARLEREAQDDADHADHAAARISHTEQLVADAESRLAEATTVCATTTQAAADAEARYAAGRALRDQARQRLDVARATTDATRRRAAAAAARADAAQARLAAIREALDRHDTLDPALQRLHQRGVRQAAAFVADAATHRLAVAAALWWLVGQAVADTSSEAVALLGDDELAGAALGCLDRMTPRAEPDRGQPLRGLVQLAADAPTTLLDGVNLVLDPAELALVKQGIVVAPDGRGFDADRGVAFRVGASAARHVALRAEQDAAVTAQASAEPDATAAAAALAEADVLLEQAEQHHAAAEASTKAMADTVEATRDQLSRSHRDVATAEREADRQRDAVQAVHAEAQARVARRANAARDQETLHATRSQAQARLTAVTATHEACEGRRVEAADRLGAWRAQQAAAHERLVRITTDRERHAAAQRHCQSRAAALEAALGRLDAVCALMEPLRDALDHAMQQAVTLQAGHEAAVAGLEQHAATLAASLSASTEREQSLQREARRLTEARTEAEVSQAQTEERLAETLRQRRMLAQQAGIEPLDRVEPLTPEEEAALEAGIERLDRRREALGAVNPLAQAEYDETRERHAATAEQIGDAEASLRELGRLVDELTATIAERFMSTYALVEANFDAVVQTLFPAGRGRVSLSAPDADPDGESSVETPEPGVELEVSPAGKRITKLALLSGGEKSLAAIAFLFSIMLARPCPFYILDEVDAALDDTNVERFLSLVDQYRDRAQFIIITHQKRTMEAADVLYGVTMAGDAVSRVVSRRLPREPVAAGA